MFIFFLFRHLYTLTQHFSSVPHIVTQMARRTRSKAALIHPESPGPSNVQPLAPTDLAATNQTLDIRNASGSNIPGKMV